MGKNHEGHSIKGSITKRLLEKFKPGDKGWNPGRPGDDAAPTRGSKLPRGVEGKKLGGRGKK